MHIPAPYRGTRARPSAMGKIDRIITCPGIRRCSFTMPATAAAPMPNTNSAAHSQTLTVDRVPANVGNRLAEANPECNLSGSGAMERPTVRNQMAQPCHLCSVYRQRNGRTSELLDDIEGVEHRVEWEYVRVFRSAPLALAHRGIHSHSLLRASLRLLRF